MSYRIQKKNPILICNRISSNFTYFFLFFNYYFINFFEKRKIFKTQFIIFLKTLLFLSIFTFIFAKFYTYKGYLLYPFPEMVALSFTRGLALYELFLATFSNLHIFSKYQSLI